jgi:hypothetical protein
VTQANAAQLKAELDAGEAGEDRCRAAAVRSRCVGRPSWACPCRVTLWRRRCPPVAPREHDPDVLVLGGFTLQLQTVVVGSGPNRAHGREQSGL